MELHRAGNSGVTLVSNAFIDQYMTGAGGEFVKVYLYLLRAASGTAGLSIPALADALALTESDVRRALNYWEKQGLIRMTNAADGSIQRLEILDADKVSAESADSAAVSAAASRASKSDHSAPAADARRQEEGAAPASKPEAASKSAVPAKPHFTAAQRTAISSNDAFRQVIFIGEQYLKRPLTNAELNNLLYFYDTLHFSPDLMDYLLEYCAEKGDPGPHYMEKVAQGWYEAGVQTPQQAREQSRQYQADYYAVFNAFGIAGRKPAAVELEYMDRWYQTYGFNTEIITQACARTVLQVSRADFRYADGILKRWHDSGVSSLADIDRMDSAHAKTYANAPAGGSKSSQSTASPRRGRSQGGSASRFSNFNQRQYNWDELSEQLSSAEEGSRS